MTFNRSPTYQVHSRKRVINLYRLLFTHFRSYPWRCIIKLGRAAYLLSRVPKLIGDVRAFVETWKKRSFQLDFEGWIGILRIPLHTFQGPFGFYCQLTRRKLCKFIHIKCIYIYNYIPIIIKCTMYVFCTIYIGFVLCFLHHLNDLVCPKPRIFFPWEILGVAGCKKPSTVGRKDAFSDWFATWSSSPEWFGRWCAVRLLCCPAWRRSRKIISMIK